MLDDLFRQVTIRPTQCRQVLLLSGRDEPKASGGRVFFGPPKPDRWRRTTEQNHEKYQRYVEKHGRDHINKLRAKHAA